MMMRTNKFTRGMILGGIIGATIGGMMSNGQTNRMRRKLMRAGRSFMKRNGVMNMITDLF